MPVTSAVQRATGRYMRPFFVETRMSDEEAVQVEVEQPVVEQAEGQEVSIDAASLEADTAEASDSIDSEGEAITPPADAAAEKPKKSGIQERINELTRQRHDKERDLEAAQQETAYWKSQAIQKPQEATAQAPTGRPTSENFDSYEDYLEALSDFKVDQRLSAQSAEREQQEFRQQFTAKQKVFNERAEKLDVDDFVEVVYDPDALYSEDMVRIAMDSEQGPELLYYLGKNPAELSRISAMTPGQAGRELGRLEASLSLPPAKTKSSAPNPINPISGGGEPPQMDQEKMSPDQWRDWRNEKLRAQGRH
jgi:hypothetical protein